jgi:hypothetical protein
MTYTSTQTRISKIKQKVGEDLSVGVLGHINTYLGSADTEADLATLCTNLKAEAALLIGLHTFIRPSNAIYEVLSACQIVNLENSIGTEQFYHSDRSHTFYTCNAPSDDTPTLLYTTTSTLSSFEAARNACYQWAANPEADLYGSYVNECSANLTPLGAFALTTCLAGMDYPMPV